MDEQEQKRSDALALHHELEEATASLNKHIAEAQQLMSESRQYLAELDANPVRRALSYVAGLFRKQ